LTVADIKALAAAALDSRKTDTAIDKVEALRAETSLGLSPATTSSLAASQRGVDGGMVALPMIYPAHASALESGGRRFRGRYDEYRPPPTSTSRSAPTPSP
jgi:hypothetical protein